MPYKSRAQRKFFNANKGKLPGLTKEVVDEWNQESAGARLPERKGKTPMPDMSKHPSSHKFMPNRNMPDICAMCGMRRNSHK